MESVKEDVLLPCPFCGGDADYENSDHGPSAWIECKSCGAKGPTCNYADRRTPSGMSLWNARSSDHTAAREAIATGREAVNEALRLQGRLNWLGNRYKDAVSTLHIVLKALGRHEPDQADLLGMAWRDEPRASIDSGKSPLTAPGSLGAHNAAVDASLKKHPFEAFAPEDRFDRGELRDDDKQSG